MSDIKCVGFGGQGVLTAGLILAHIAMDNGFEVSWTPLYTSEMRGGSAICDVRIRREGIACPYVKDMDVLIAMNGDGALRFEGQVRPGGVMVVNSSLMPENYGYRRDISVVEVPAIELSRKAGNPKGLNIIMLSAAVGAAKLFDEKLFAARLDAYFKAKGHASSPKNKLCMELGFEAAQSGKAA